MKKNISGIMLIFLTAAAFAADVGVILGTDGQYTGAINPEGFSLTACAAPWVSAVLNEKLTFHASERPAYDYAENGEPPGAFFFEPERTELHWRPVSSVYATLGRQRFQDTLGLAVSGFFDGAGGSLDFGTVRLSLGVFYTGLLPGLRALMSGGLSSRVRPLAAVSAGAGAAYFIRTDLETLGDRDVDGTSDSRLLGGELYSSLVWAPDPALRFNAGGGAFFPGWGGAFCAGAPVRRCAGK
jgi:hypothetical protein